MTVTIKKSFQKYEKPKKKVFESIGVVSEMIRETSDTQTLRIKTPFLDSQGNSFLFKPGQFVMVVPKIQNKVISRAYSISSSPTRSIMKNGHFDLTVRQTDKPLVSKWLNDRKMGDEIPFRGPYGNFFWDEQDSHAEQLFLVGSGSGITPLKSILEYIYDRRYLTKVHLLYSCRFENEIISRDAIEAMIKSLPNSKLILTLTRENKESRWSGQRGRLNIEIIERELQSNNFDLEKTKFFLCGTPEFVNSMTDIFLRLGIDKLHILYEKW